MSQADEPSYTGDMRILAVDIGTGTQDILLFDSSGPVENSPKLVMPSPTTVAADRIRSATAARETVVLTGVVAGGGPCAWALGDHIRAGLPAFATPTAALTLDDDLRRVEAEGVRLVSDDEAAGIAGAHVRLHDLDLDAIRTALRAFNVATDFDGIAVGVFRPRRRSTRCVRPRVSFPAHRPGADCRPRCALVRRTSQGVAGTPDEGAGGPR
jgi:uncharacterized protein (DUF1786 family)